MKIGEVFELMLGRGPSDTKATLTRAAIEALYAENAMWNLYSLHDPVTAGDFAEMRKAREAAQDEENHRAKSEKRAAKKIRWPRLAEYRRLSVKEEAASPDRICKRLCPSLSSNIYSAICQHVFKFYHKSRFEFLAFRKRLPVSDDLRIRFREKAVRITRDERNPAWFRVEMTLFRDPDRPGRCLPPTIVAIATRGKSRWTNEWLGRCADEKTHPSGGMISARRKRGKLVWQISLSRERENGERRQVVDPVAGRTLTCEAPLEQEAFLRCCVDFDNGRPWCFAIEGHDLLNTKIAAEKMRRERGRNYAQSPNSAAHGHGRNAVLRSKMAFGERYENRVKDWIENRTIYIVQKAIEMKCSAIRMEELTTRDPHKLLLGSFPYYQFINRLKCKTIEAGLDFKTFERAQMTIPLEAAVAGGV